VFHKIRGILSGTDRLLILKIFSMVSILTASIITLFFYRRGGVVDAVYGAESSQGFRDTGIYARAAEKLLSGLSPYLDSSLSFRSGPFGVLLFALIPMSPIAFICYQIFNIIGILVFCKVFLRDSFPQESYFICLALTIYFSCVREIFSTGQITGILAGLIAFGYEGVKSQRISARLGGAFLFALALDLKPNLFVFFVLGSFIFLDRKREFWLPCFFLLCGHLIIDLHAGRLLERDWISTLMAVSDPERDPSNTGTRTIWPLVKSWLQLEFIPSAIPTLVFILLGCTLLYALLKTNNQYIFFLTLIVPAFYNYYHLYSFFPFAAIIFAIMISRSMPITLGVVLPLLLVSGAHFGFGQLLYCSFLLGVVLFLLAFTNPMFQNVIFARHFLTSSTVVILARFVFQLKLGSSWIQEIYNLNFLVLFGIGLLLWVSFTEESSGAR